MSGPLQTLKILDFTQNLPGPICTLYMADMGADVIKVEPPLKGDPIRGAPGSPINPLVAYLHRNKRSLELDLKSKEGRDVILKLIQEYDIIVEGFRPGVMKKLGLDYETLKALQPNLIYCSISGYGQTSPLAEKGGHDINFLARSSVASLMTNEDNEPVIPRVQIADAIAGYQAMVGILAAFVSRGATGNGQYIDLSMTDATFSFMHFEAALNLGKKEFPGRGVISGSSPFYQYYKCLDGKYLALGAVEPVFAQRVAEFFQCPMDKDSLSAAIAKKTRDEWIEQTAHMDMCLEPVLHMYELKHDENLKAREMIIEVDGQLQSALPIKFSGFKPGKPKSAPALGADNDEIMAGL